MSDYYEGPVSDRFDGERFLYPHGAPPRTRRDLLRWFVDRRWRAAKSQWPSQAPSAYVDCPPPRVEGATCRISYVGHASFLIQTADLNMLLAPVRSRNPTLITAGFPLDPFPTSRSVPRSASEVDQ